MTKIAIPPNEADDAKIRRVAAEIQELLVREKMAIIPTISLQIVADVPDGGGKIVNPETVPDFMQ